MEFEEIKADDIEDKFLLLGVIEYSTASAKHAFSEKNSFSAMRELLLKIKTIESTCWNLPVLAMSAGEGDDNSIAMFEKFKDQLSLEIKDYITSMNNFYKKL